MVHVIATITAKPGTRDRVIEAFRWVTPLVRAEDGCLEYQPATDVPTTLAAQDGPRADVVTVVEKWASVDALYAHTKATHMAEYRERVKEFVLGVRLVVAENA